MFLHIQLSRTILFWVLYTSCVRILITINFHVFVLELILCLLWSTKIMLFTVMMLRDPLCKNSNQDFFFVCLFVLASINTCILMVSYNEIRVVESDWMMKWCLISTTGSFDSVKGHIHYSNVLIQAIPDEVLKGHVYLYILVCPDVNIVLEFDCIF